MKNKEEIILSTRNPGKAEQIKAIFDGSSFIVKTLAEAGIAGDVEETGKTLSENAYLKARFAFEHANQDTFVFADDTGLFIPALNGEPGIKSARWAGEKAKTSEIRDYCLKRLEGTNNRRAYFKTVVALINPDEEVHYFHGKVWGRIIEQPQGYLEDKMPYATIFMPNWSKRTWAEMTIDEENKVSHRGMAFRMARKSLERMLKQYNR